MNLFRPTLGLLGTITLVWLNSAQVASACSYAECRGSIRAFSATRVPGNLLLFKLRGNDTPSVLRMTRADGSVIPASIRTVGSDRVFSPDAPLETGVAVTVESSQEPAFQNGPLPTCDRVDKLTLKTTAPVEVASALPRLEVLAQGFESTPDGKLSRVHFGYDSGAGAAEHLRDISATLDGLPLWATADGEGGAGYIVRTNCDRPMLIKSSCGDVAEVEPGRHELRVVTTIVGQPAPRELRAIVDTTCDGEGAQVLELTGGLDSETNDAGAAPPAVDAGGGSAGEPDVTTSTGTDGGAPSSTSESVTAADSDDDGCSTHSRAPTSWSLLLSLALLLRRRHKTQV